MQLITINYFQDVATGRRTRVVPFEAISKSPSIYIDPIYLPTGFVMKDPRNMKGEAIIAFFKHIADREKVHRSSDVFRFSRINGSRKATEILHTLYPGEASHDPPMASSKTTRISNADADDDAAGSSKRQKNKKRRQLPGPEDCNMHGVHISSFTVIPQPPLVISPLQPPLDGTDRHAEASTVTSMFGIGNGTLDDSNLFDFEGHQQPQMDRLYSSVIQQGSINSSDRQEGPVNSTRLTYEHNASLRYADMDSNQFIGDRHFGEQNMAPTPGRAHRELFNFDQDNILRTPTPLQPGFFDTQSAELVTNNTDYLNADAMNTRCWNTDGFGAGLLNTDPLNLGSLDGLGNDAPAPNNDQPLFLPIPNQDTNHLGLLNADPLNMGTLDGLGTVAPAPNSEPPLFLSIHNQDINHMHVANTDSPNTSTLGADHMNSDVPNADSLNADPPTANVPHSKRKTNDDDRAMQEASKLLVEGKRKRVVRERHAPEDARKTKAGGRQRR